MTTATMTLTDFLLARIAEDERRAHSGVVTLWQRGRMLAECEAKRRIVALQPSHTQSCGAYHPGQDVYHPEGHPNEVLVALASIYADHPDYREDWRP